MDDQSLSDGVVISPGKAANGADARVTHPVDLQPRALGDDPAAANVPLVVDLDGTLILSDTLVESALVLIKQKPWLVFSLAAWLLQGRAVVKAEIARRVKLSVENLPYRAELLEYLKVEREAGRSVILATAAHGSIAEAIAAQTGLFAEVLASDTEINLKGPRKRDALVERFGVRQFDYVGDSRDDVPVWEASRVAHVAGAVTKAPASALAAGAMPGLAFSNRKPTFRTWLRAMRIHQWLKNVLVFIPPVMAHQINGEVMWPLAITFFAFSLLASATYIVNDLFDLASDRMHPKKSTRPFASGELSIAQGFVSAVFLGVAGIALGATVGLPLVACLLAYLAMTLTYSHMLKNKPVIDVVLLAVLHTLRVFTGGIVSGFFISAWLFQFSIFLFLSLAFVKRYSELRRLHMEEKSDTPGRGYRHGDRDIVSQAGVATGVAAGLVLALYINGQDIQRLYPRPYMLWIVCPLFVYWITRVWLIAHRGNMSEDPILFAMHDKVSYIVGGLILGAAVLGMTPGAA